MTAKLSAAARAWFAAQGKIGGAAGTGKAKRRDPAFYAKIGKLSADARAANKLKSPPA